jgi:hypothetical protein
MGIWSSYANPFIARESVHRGTKRQEIIARATSIAQAHFICDALNRLEIPSTRFYYTGETLLDALHRALLESE